MTAAARIVPAPAEEPAQEEAPKYAWNRAYHGRRVPADAVKAELDSIAFETNGMTPAAVLVERARPEDHPIHHGFEWDDSVAGERYRVEQAREMIRCLIPLADARPSGMGAARSAPLYVHVRRTQPETGAMEDGYMELREVRKDPELLSQVRANAFRQAKSLLDRYQSIKELKPVSVALQAAADAAGVDLAA